MDSPPSSSNVSETSKTPTPDTPQVVGTAIIDKKLLNVRESHSPIESKSESNSSVKSELIEIKSESNSSIKSHSSDNEIKDDNPQKPPINKLCTLLNHTPLVMQVKNVEWIEPEKKDAPTILNCNSKVVPTVSIEEDEDDEAKPKLKIVSDEKSNLSAHEIESMLNKGKMLKSNQTISSPQQKQYAGRHVARENSKTTTDNTNTNNNTVEKTNSTEKPQTSKENSNDPGIVKKECLKRIQAKMYENLKKVLDEVDSLPARDKAPLSIPAVSTTSDSTVSSSAKQSLALKSTERIKDKPCYMSTYRERKTVRSTPDGSIEIISGEPQSNEEVIKIDDDDVKEIKVPKKRGRPPRKPDTPEKEVDVNQEDSEKATIIIIDNPVNETLVRKNRSTPFKKSIVQKVNEPEAKLPSEEAIDQPKRKRGRPRKNVNTILDEEIASDSIVVEAESKSESEDLPPSTPRKRGRPPKIGRPNVTKRKSESPSNTETKEDDSVIVEKPATLAQSASQDTPTEVKVHKKRGRKTKAEMEALRKESRESEKTPKVEDTSSYTQSRISGRKRKVVDYSLLNGEDSDADDSEVTFKKAVYSQKRMPKREVFDEDDFKSSEDEYGSSKSAKKRNRDSSDEEVSISAKKIKQKDESKDVVEKNKKIESDEAENTEIEEVLKYKIKEGAKSNKTENSEADDDVEEWEVIVEVTRSYNKKNKGSDKAESDQIKNEEAEEDETENEEAKNKSDVVETSRRISQKDIDTPEKKAKDLSNEEIKNSDLPNKKTKDLPNEEAKDLSNEEATLKPDQVECAVCADTVEKSTWPEHKKTVHNDLAWISGEPPLNLEDTTVVEDILNSILQRDGILKCTTCEKEIDCVKSYVQHKNDCKMYLENSDLVLSKNSDSGQRKRRGRKPGAVTEILSSLISNIKPTGRITEHSENDDENSSVPDNSTELQKNQTRCAICFQILTKSLWFMHKQSVHNNLAWRVGEQPLDLSDSTFVINVLNKLYKKGKFLHCEICGSNRKSVMGFLSHKSQCQKSEGEIIDLKVTCHLCKRTMLPVSLSRHMVLSHSEPGTCIMSDNLDEANNTLSTKRKAKNKAVKLLESLKEDSHKMKKIVKGVRFRSVDEVITKFNEDIKKFNEASCVFEKCTYTATDVEDLFQHIENCMERHSVGYTCNYCLITFKWRKSAREHVSAMHPYQTKDDIIMHDISSDEESFRDADGSSTDEEDTNLFDEPLASKPRKVPSQKVRVPVKFLGLQKRKALNSCYSNAFKWTLDYYKENYSVENVFPNIIYDKTYWKQLDNREILQYLPKLKQSIDTAAVKVTNYSAKCNSNYQWVKYKLFQSEIQKDGISTIFCGGPVSAMSWAPTPYNMIEPDQILAISVMPDPDKKYFGMCQYRGNALIQFWNYGPLNNKIIPIEKPKLEYCIAHDHGVVWSLEWCPSGCYDNNDQDGLQRLGLLAVGTSDSCVYIYTVLKPKQISGKVLTVPPTFKLILENVSDIQLGEILYHATKISWTKAAGHSYIAVGFSNGIVGIYNLKTKSKLLRTNIDDVIVLKPMQILKAHSEYITALQLSHLCNGNRWLISGSLDKETKLWDLQNTAEPLTYNKRFVVTDAIWMMHWLYTVYSYDHNTLTGSVSSALVPARNFNGSTVVFLPSNSRTTSVSCSDWGNLFIQSNVSGEIICGFPDQLLYSVDNDKRRMHKTCRAITSYTGCIAKNLTPSERLENEKLKLNRLRNQNSNFPISEPKTYKKASDYYGLVFFDLNMGSGTQNPSQELNKLIHSPSFYSVSKPEMYPIQMINKVVLNPNRQSYMYYACGYQAGLVRTSVLRFLND